MSYFMTRAECPLPLPLVHSGTFVQLEAKRWRKVVLCTPLWAELFVKVVSRLHSSLVTVLFRVIVCLLCLSHLNFASYSVCLVTTAIFAVCGMNIFVFMLAAALSMPKQFITVYIGTLLESDASCMFSPELKMYILMSFLSVDHLAKQDRQ